MQFSAVAVTGSENLKVKILHFSKLKSLDKHNEKKFLAILDVYNNQDMN